MREWEFGIFDSQAADIDGDCWGARSMLVFPATNSTNQEDWPGDFNTDEMQMGYGTGAEPMHYQCLIDTKLTQLKAKLGQIPVLLRADWTWMAKYAIADNAWMEVSRMYVGWDIGDTSNRYKDHSALITWYEDAYSPYQGQDRATERTDLRAAAPIAQNELLSFNVTPIVERALRDNTSIKLWFHGYTGGGTSYIACYMKPSVVTARPRYKFWYLYPIEFYESVGGAIDYSSTVQETEDGHYYLGAVERGSTGAAVQGWVRNYTETTKQVELFDDHPEWITPVQRVGTGTGQLDFVSLADNATSQLYTVVFYSATEYEVKAEAYRDNAIGYHPQIDANGSWRSDTSSTWVAPSGGLTITAAMWQAALISSGDEFEFGVRGNTTDTSWPADSNDQVEMTYNVAGSPDATAWRPAVGRREHATAAVTIDSASKFFPLRHALAAQWLAGVPCYVHDQDNIDEGTITSSQERDLGTDTHTGSGLDDLVAPTGNYNGNENRTYRLQIDANGTPDTFSWSRDGTTTWVQTGINVQSTSFELEDGVWIYWSATTGHTIGDYWTFDADTWGVTVGGLSITSNAYASGAIVATTLPIRDLAKAKWSTVSAASGTSQSPASRIYLEDTSDYTQSDVVFVQQIENSGIYEVATIAAGGVQATYIDLTTSLTNDYAIGDYCTVQGSGEDAFWMRPVATSTTVEELKRLRFNARIL